MIEAATIARCFDKGAARYDNLAQIQNKVADSLFASVLPEVVDANHIVDLGCGTGRLLSKCQTHNPLAELTGVDCSSAMLDVAASRVSGGNWLNQNLVNIALGAESQCLVLSSSAMQWVPIEQALKEAARVTKVGGLIAISTYLDETLLEWRRLWRAEILEMPTEEQCVDAAEKVGLSIKRVETNWQTQWCDGFETAVSSVRGLGAGANRRSSKGLFGRREFARIKENVNAQVLKFGAFPMRYHVVSMLAIKEC